MENKEEISGNIDQIQHLFLNTGYFLPVKSGLEAIISFLEKEPNVYRSLAYESAAYEIAYLDLKAGSALSTYQDLYRLKGALHPFHMQIGLGWAFAKAEVSPDTYPLQLPFHTQQMVYDGYGYYHALFKARKTLLSQLVPADITEENQNGYDQGIGRRLWYISRGDVNELDLKINAFEASRRADMWRGVGIGCGYVGGTNRSILEQLRLSSGKHKASLSTGIALAAFSRVNPDAVIPSIELACEVVCGMSIKEVVKLIPRSDEGIRTNWITILETEFL